MANETVRTSDIVLVLFVSTKLREVLAKAREAFGDIWDLHLLVDSEAFEGRRGRTVTAAHQKILQAIFDLRQFPSSNWNAEAGKFSGGTIGDRLTPARGTHYIVVTEGASADSSFLIPAVTRILAHENASVSVYAPTEDGFKRVYPEKIEQWD